MHLVLLTAAGPAGFTWQHPADRNRFLEADYWDSVAKTLEDAKFDAIFFADGQIFFDDVTVQKGGELYFLDPQPLAMSIARATKHLGIGITVSSSFFEPYGLARSLGTIDLLSGGRLAWNVVTSTSNKEAQCYGMDKLLDRAERYDRADEVVDACVQLWNSFGDDAFVVDKQSGTFIDPTKLTSFDYAGRYVKTKGPLTAPPSAQGHPVIMQAGASERGQEFAARWAEVLFTQQYTLSHMQKFYAGMKSRVAAAGRSPDDCVILPQITVTVGETESIAREKNAFLKSLMNEDAVVSRLGAHIGVDLSDAPRDQPPPYVKTEIGARSVIDSMMEVSKAENLTLAEVARRYATNGLAPELVGTPEQVADQMQELFEQRGCDGFMISVKGMPGSIEDFARMVVPILQERGLFRSEYPGTTLRASLKG